MFGQPSKSALRREIVGLNETVEKLHARIGTLEAARNRVNVSYERRELYLTQLGIALATTFGGTVIDHEVIPATPTEPARAITTIGDEGGKVLYTAAIRPEIEQGELLLTATRFTPEEVKPLVVDLQAESWGDVLPEDIEDIEAWIELAKVGPAPVLDPQRHERRFVKLQEATKPPANGKKPQDDAPTDEIRVSTNGTSPHGVGVNR